MEASRNEKEKAPIGIVVTSIVDRSKESDKRLCRSGADKLAEQQSEDSLLNLESQENHQHFNSVVVNENSTSCPISSLPSSPTHVPMSIDSDLALDNRFSSQDSSESGFEMELIQPPGGGKPMLIKRGPGRPRKDGICISIKTTKPLNKLRLASSSFVNNNRARGRKKNDGMGYGPGHSSDLNMIGQESPPRLIDDTAESDTSSVASSLEKVQEDFSLFPEQWPGRVCAFCNLGEKSMLGQGDLIRKETPSGFEPLSFLRIHTERTKSDKPKDSSYFLVNNSIKRQKGSEKIRRLVSQNSLEGQHEPNLEVVGYVEKPELQTVFNEKTAGYFYFVHSHCASWSNSNAVSDAQKSHQLESEIIAALGQQCSFCRRYGAGVKCKKDDCNSTLHFPCIAMSGSFQESANKSMICSTHLDSVVSIVGKAANCTVCDMSNSLSLMVICSSCGHHYHTHCMALNADPEIRAGWQCPACKVCQSCRQPGDESKLLACDTCDKAYHIFCLRPALTSSPKHSWKCKMCRVCTDCGARAPGSGPSSRWHTNFSVCDSCYQQRNKGLACPLCGKAYRHVAQKMMLQCTMCKKFVHKECDAAADVGSQNKKKEIASDIDYVCITCKDGCGGSVKTSSSGQKLALSEIHGALISLPTFGTQLSQDAVIQDVELISHQPSLEDVFPPPLFPTKIATSTPSAPKRKNGPGRLKSVDKCSVGTGGNRRQRLSEIARKRGPKPKIRGVFGIPGVGLLRPSSELSKGEDEPGVENRLVLCSAKDEFVLQQDACVMCGAFGNDFEGRLISCAQCGQCYHPYCVNVKITKVILQKGWRCLDCTVCEGCGQRNDEARLILCDDCDISYHIYCMNPPLDHVPQGNWKCKWCATCQYCGSNYPGKNSLWHNNYKLCGPCNSLSTCPVCQVDYIEGVCIIQCQSCDRWLHTTCDGINNQDEAEICSEQGYKCILCRPHHVPPPHLVPPPPVIFKAISPSRNFDGTVKAKPLIQIEGVHLSEQGLSHIRSLTLDQPRKKRKKTSTSAEAEAGILDAIESVVANSISGKFDKPVKSDMDPLDASDKDKDGKKRQRTLQKFGVGGFLVRLRGGRFKDDDFDGFQESLGSLNELDKPKRKPQRRKIKNKLVESFPSYLQEAFFGRELMDTGKDTELASGDENELENTSNVKSGSLVSLSKDEMQVFETVTNDKQSEKVVLIKNDNGHIHTSVMLDSDPNKNIQKSKIKTEEDVVLQDILPLSGDLLDSDLVDTIMNEDGDIKVGHGLEDLSVEDDISQGTRSGNHHKDELTDFLSSQFNLESIDTGLPSMDGKDVEDIFKGVLTDESQESEDAVFQTPCGLGTQQNSSGVTASAPTTPSPIFQSLNPISVSPGGHTNQGITRSTSLPASVQPGLASPVGFPPPSPYHSEYSNSPQFSPAFSEPPSPWPTLGSDADADQPTGTYNQRSILKWEVDECLGTGATISAVLYSNTNHPELKRDYPNWNERSKQIAKIWRGLPADKRAPYLQKARENRAAGRIQKAQIPKENKFGSSSKSETCKLSQDVENHKTASANSTASVPDNTRSVDAIDQICARVDADRTSGYDFSIPSISSSSFVSSDSTELASLTAAQRNYINHSGSGSLITCPPLLQLTQSKRISTVPGSQNDPSLLQTSKPLETIEKKCLPQMDQQIRVLTPSEIMRTLPTLTQETGQFSPSLEQEKPSTCGPVKVARAETPEERHWKQMQVYRQQQAQQQQHLAHRMADGKQDQIGNVSPKQQFQLSPAQRQLSSDSSPVVGLDIISSRQPLQISTSMDQSMISPLSSPHLQSPTSRQIFVSGIQQPNRVRPPTQDMVPPSSSPHYSPKANMTQAIPLPGTARPSIYSRVPYMNLPRPSNPSNSELYSHNTSDVYPHSPATNRTISDNNNDPFQASATEQFLQSTSSASPNNSIPSATLNQRPNLPQGQETRQHLRDLLQRQQNKKIEQEQISSNAEVSQTQPPPRWTPEEWQKNALPDTENYQLKAHEAQVTLQNQFRHPSLPPQIRLNHKSPMLSRTSVTEFRPMINQSQMASQSTDPRLQLLIQHHQQRTLMPSQLNNGGRSLPFQLPTNQQSLPISEQSSLNHEGQFRLGLSHRNVLDPYDQLVTKKGSSISSSMLAQQLGRPLNSPSMGRSESQVPVHPMHLDGNEDSNSDLNRNNLSSGRVTTSSSHQELPDNVAAELEKLEQEHGDSGAEGDGNELADLGMDDDELLGMGADFNILEYADPELDQVVGGEKTNILDEIDDEEKDEKTMKRKDDQERSVKKEPEKNDFQNMSCVSRSENKVDGSSQESSDHPVLSPNYSQRLKPEETHCQVIGTPQPPPPYPGPPPPYPGRHHSVPIGIRNGDGLNMQSMPSTMSISTIVKNSTLPGIASSVGMRFPQLPASSMPPANTLSVHQRRTLLLQEQPLLLEDLLEQEKREQQRQGPGLSGPSEDSLLSDFDFERLKADVLCAPNLPNNLSPTNQNVQVILPQTSQSIFARSQSLTSSNLRRGTDWSAEPDPNIIGNSRNTDKAADSGSLPKQQSLSQQPNLNINSPTAGGARVISFPVQNVPPPPIPPEHPATEQDRQMEIKYEQWLYHQQHVLTVQLKYFDTEVNKLRKAKKSYNSKQRQLRKNGGELNETDTMELDKIIRELGGLQKHLDHARKQSRQHGILAQEYRTKQQKRQQLNISQGSVPAQASPLSCSTQSPLHSTPQSPMLSPSPSMSGPSPSSITQNSPMACPLTPSPGPAMNSLAQTSPRSNALPHLEDRPFSPNNNNPNIRVISSHQGGQTRLQTQQGGQLRMGSPVTSPKSAYPPLQTFNNSSLGNNMNMMTPRGITLYNTNQQRPMIIENVQRVIAIRPGDQMHRMLQMPTRFQRTAITQEIIRSRIMQQGFQTHVGQISQGNSPQHFSNPRTPFGSQSPSALSMNIAPLRSPSPLTGHGSPINPSSQSGVSPANSPMRRPSGSGGGLGSPLPSRPKSVENPLTPRSSGSEPHTPSSVGPSHGLDSSYQSNENTQYNNQDTEISNNMLSHGVQQINLPNLKSPYAPNDGGGGGGGNSQVIPYPTFAWFHGSSKLGLKGGQPFSVVTGKPTHHQNVVSTSRTTIEQIAQSSLSLETTNTDLPQAHSLNTRATISSGESNGPTTSESTANITKAVPEIINTISLPPPLIVAEIAVEQGFSRSNDLNEATLTNLANAEAKTENSVTPSQSNSPSVSSQISIAGIPTQQTGESQNALLKQLLQNTGCASTNQVQPEASGFSLSNCLPGRSTNIQSHLSEAATRIPQPTPVVRSTETTTPNSTSPTRIQFFKSESEVPEPIITLPAKISTSQSSNDENKPETPTIITIKTEPQLDTISASLKECIETVATDKSSFDPTTLTRRADVEARKAKRRQYQAKRRQSSGKDSSVQPKKRTRKGSKVEEDFDSHIETLMGQLKHLLPVGIVEPVLAQNYHVSSPPGIGDMSKLGNKDYSLHLGDLEGSLFFSSVANRSDFYTTRPFGDEHPHRYQSQPSNQRGFYNQEFGLPRVLVLGTKLNLDSPSPVRESDSPDTVVSSSSVDCDNENVFPYPGLRLGDSDEEQKSGRSPGISFTCTSSHVCTKKENEELDKENKHSDGVPTRIRVGTNGIPLKENGNTLVTLTLSSTASQDVTGILRNLANLLSVSPLCVFQVEQTMPPPSSKLAIFTYKSKDGKETIDLQSILNGAAKFCKHCDVIVLNNIIKRKATDLPELVPPVKADSTDEFCFCSQNCLMQFAMTHGIAVTSEKVGTVVNHPGTAFSESSQKIETNGNTPNTDTQLESKDNNKLKKSVSKDDTEEDASKSLPAKKWLNIKYKKWLPSFIPTPKFKKPTDKELTEMLFRLGITVHMPNVGMPEDTRKCYFCHQYGDTVSDGSARLLNLDVDKWVHLNCALWSDEVYETESGALVNVELALKHSLSLTCIACNQNGATVKCFKVRCCSVYHLGCAVKEGCVFYQNKTIYCSAHIPKGEKENELTTLAVFRRVYIQRDENRQVAAVMHHADQHHLLRVGSLIFLSVGQLLPHQLQAFHSPNYIYPIGYKIVRFYWSMTRINKRCQYICSIHEVDSKPEFQIATQEDSCKEVVLKGETASKVWSQVLDAVAKLRISSGCIKLFPKYITGEDLFGLTEPTIMKVLESLPGVETLTDYHFKYGRNPLLELPLAINPTGCARSEPKLRTHFKRPHTQRTGGSRTTYSASIISSSETACPYSKQFVHSKSSQYKKMKQDWRNNVYLARSKIQGLGLYAARDIEKHTMVIEYIGEIIRSELAETREKKYEAQNRGIYMFRVDEDRVIDATLCGGLARYINHSCNPNCVAETVEVDRDLRIIIFSNRRICRGEELAYDYKFEFEDDGHKIPCSCGAVNCREWMN